MKKIILSVLIIMGLAGVWLASRGHEPEAAGAGIREVSTQPEVNKIITVPVAIKIPKLGVQTQVESVGMQEDGRMGVPSSAETVSWWEPGTKPGERGSAVLAGHLDTPEGAAGIFYDLDKLHPGDQVIITDRLGSKYNFEVIEQKTYQDASFPIDKVFAVNDGTYLNLITCSGSFDKASKNYEQRLVVYTKFIEVEWAL